MKKITIYFFLTVLMQTVIGSCAHGQSGNFKGESNVLPDHLGSRIELFVDTLLIESMVNVSLELQKPKVAERSMDFREKKWEGPWAGQGPTILKDDAVYRMYYFVPLTTKRVGGETDGGTAYAESSDGIHWRRPNLGQVLYEGSRDNNFLQLPEGIHSLRIIRPFIDTRPGVSPSEKYKAVAGATTFTGPDSAKYTDGLYILVSSDGLHWKRFADTPYVPAQRYSSADGQSNFPNPVDYDGMNTAFWSEAENQYVSLYRGWIHFLPLKSPDESYGGTGWYRWIKKTTSKDLIHWTSPVLMNTGELGPEQWYMHSMSPYFRSGEFFIGMPSHYITVKNSDFSDSLHSGHVARCEVRFVTSRAGTIELNREFANDRFIKDGLPNKPDFFFKDLSDWPVFAGRMGLNLVPTSESEMSCYLEQAGRIVRYTLRTDGFTALTAKGKGVVITKPVFFDGSNLEINFSTQKGGTVKVELEDAAGNPLGGYALSDAIALTGDFISKKVSWKNKTSVRSLAGKKIKIKFLLDRASLFAYQFTDSSKM